MGRLYVFGIGGTGARVLRSLAMLLASGVDCKATEVIPIIIDADKENGDLRRTEKLLNDYCDIRGYKRSDESSALNFTDNKDRKNKFFGTKITKSKFDAKESFCLPIKITGVNDTQAFGNYIEESALAEKNQALINMLFSKENLSLELKHGFKGNPNIGSVVLNQFDEAGLRQIFDSFTNDDRIFIISSIFGGTGSSGFPLLLKTLRGKGNKGNPQIDIPQTVIDSCIGAISVMPYFSVNSSSDKKSEVDSQTFISKSIAAMDYYHKDIIGKINDNDTSACIDYMYSIADEHTNPKDRAEGGDKQKNDAHFVELASALAILDFLKKDYKQNGDNHITKKLRFAVDSEGRNGELEFGNLSRATLDILRKPLTQFWLFARYVAEKGDKRFQTLPVGKDLGDSKFFTETHGFYREMEKFFKGFDGYLYELEETKSFIPYSNNKEEDIFLRIRGVSEKKKGLFSSNETGWDLFETSLNEQMRVLKGQGPEERFLEIFYRGTDGAIKKRLNDW